MKKRVFTVCLLALLLTSCAGPTDIVTSKQRIFGLRLCFTGQSQAPVEVDLGLVTQVYQKIPTSTNGTVYAPKYADTFEISQSINPFDFSVLENTGAGDVAIGTNATSTAIVPKLHANTNKFEDFIYVPYTNHDPSWYTNYTLLTNCATISTNCVLTNSAVTNR